MTPAYCIGKPKAMPRGMVKNELLRAEQNGDNSSLYYQSLKNRLAELRGRR